MDKFLFIGNNFQNKLLPYYRDVRFRQIGIERARELIDKFDVISFWKYPNILEVAAKIFGDKIYPISKHPHLQLFDQQWVLEGKLSDQILVISPIFEHGFKPKVKIKVTENQIIDWSILFIQIENIEI